MPRKEPLGSMPRNSAQISIPQQILPLLAVSDAALTAYDDSPRRFAAPWM